MNADNKTGIADVDGSEMKLFERPVDLPEHVVVVDGKLGKEIGFVERDKVMGLLATDRRYSGFEDGCTGQFMLSYNSDGAKEQTIVLETDDVIRFLTTIKNNLVTAIGADDPKRFRLGVSYEGKGRSYVLSINVSDFTKSLMFLDGDIVQILSSSGDDEEISGGPTERIIGLFRSRVNKKEATGE